MLADTPTMLRIFVCDFARCTEGDLLSFRLGIGPADIFQLSFDRPREIHRRGPGGFQLFRRCHEITRLESGQIHSEASRGSDQAGPTDVHLANRRCHLRDRPHFFDDESMRQEPLIDQLDDPLVGLLGPDRPIMFAPHVHEPLGCDQDSCKARPEIRRRPQMEITNPTRGSRFPNLRLGLVITGFLVAAGTLLGTRTVDWFLLKKSLRHRFANIEWISTNELADWLADKRRPSPVLLDVRTLEEWNISHLPGARRVDPNAASEIAAAGLSKQTAIVTYCAVGYRSGEMADRLARCRL